MNSVPTYRVLVGMVLVFHFDSNAYPVWPGHSPCTRSLSRNLWIGFCYDDALNFCFPPQAGMSCYKGKMQGWVSSTRAVARQHKLCTGLMRATGRLPTSFQVKDFGASLAVGSCLRNRGSLRKASWKYPYPAPLFISYWGKVAYHAATGAPV